MPTGGSWSGRIVLRGKGVGIPGPGVAVNLKGNGMGLGLKLVAAPFIAAGVAGLFAATGATDVANATGCASGGAFGFGGGYCDFDYASDGSYTHCESTYVFGIGGRNCYRVYPGVPQP
jgi:hypothetical protein